MQLQTLSKCYISAPVSLVSSWQDPKNDRRKLLVENQGCLLWGVMEGGHLVGFWGIHQLIIPLLVTQGASLCEGFHVSVEGDVLRVLQAPCSSSGHLLGYLESGFSDSSAPGKEEVVVHGLVQWPWQQVNLKLIWPPVPLSSPLENGYISYGVSPAEWTGY